MCINMGISNLPLGALHCTIQLSIMPPPPAPLPPAKEQKQKQNRDHMFRKS